MGGIVFATTGQYEVTDQLLSDSVTAKFNTLDFATDDPIMWDQFSVFVGGDVSLNDYKSAVLVRDPLEVSHSGGPPTPKSCVGYWRLGETSVTDFVDSSPYQGVPRPAVASGGITYAVPNGFTNDEPNLAAKFNGSTGIATVAFLADLHPGDTFTIKFMFKTSAAVQQAIIDAGSGDFEIYLTAAGKLACYKGATGDIVVSAASYNDGVWHHGVWIKAGAVNTLIVDGVDITGAATVINRTIVGGANPITIGGGAAGFFNGSLDEISISNYAQSVQTAKRYGKLVTAYPRWVGTISSITTTDRSNLRDGHVRVVFTGTNQNVIPTSGLPPTPFVPSDQPNGGNLLTATQASLEGGITGWNANGNCAIAQSAAQALDGTQSLRLTSTAAGDMKATTDQGAGGFAVLPNNQYSAGAYFRSAVSARSCTLRIYWYQKDGTASAIRAFDFFGSITDTTSGWTQMAATPVTSPADAAFAAIEVIVSATGAGGEVHYVDEIGLSEGSSAAWRVGGTRPSKAVTKLTVRHTVDGVAGSYTTLRDGLQVGQTVSIYSQQIQQTGFGAVISITTRFGGQTPIYLVEFGAVGAGRNALLGSMALAQPPGPGGTTNWLDWTPTVTPGGSMTMTPAASDSRTHARFCQFGKLVLIDYAVVWNLGGTLSDNAAFTLPIPAKYKRSQFTGEVQNVPARVGMDSADAVSVRRYDNAAFTGQSWFAFQGIYEAA